MTVPHTQRRYPTFSCRKDRDEYLQKLLLHGYRVHKAARVVFTCVNQVAKRSVIYTVADIDGRKGPVSNGE